jgi:pimeloyl-ACP methyl ester carboxylesterase
MIASTASKLNARVTGRSGDVLVLSHGMGSDQSVWRHVLPQLAPYFTVVTYDLACAGTVAPDVFDMRHYESLDGYADDLLTLLDELGIANCHFIGHSVSGMIGLLASARLPDRFRQIITIGASPRYLDDGSYQGGFTRAAVAEIFDAIGHHFRDWARSFAPFAVGRDPDDPACQAFADSLMAMRPDIALLLARTIFLGDWRDRLTDCGVPVVLVQARFDPAVPVAVAHYLHDHLRHSALEIIETAGHLPHLSAPEVLTEVLTRHLPLAKA